MKRGGIKISTMLVSMLLVSLIIVTFSSFFADVSIKYGSSYDNNTNTSIELYNQYIVVENTTKTIDSTLFNQSAKGGVISEAFDLLGSFLGAGFNVLKLTKSSVTGLYSMTENASEAIELDNNYKNVIFAIIMVLVVFAIIGVLVGRDI